MPVFVGLFALVIASGGATARSLPDCGDYAPLGYETLRNELRKVVALDNGGFGLPMWASIVDRNGVVCFVARSGAPGEQWPGSRVISAQKANTANAFSLPGLALSTANLWSATQPGGSLFGLQFANPVDTAIAYGDASGGHTGSDASAYGEEDDPMVGRILGGTNVFGGGLALYDEDGTLLGALGVSGDSSCADHNIAWRLRDRLGLDYVPAGVAPGDTDNIIYDLVGDPPRSESGFGHPACGLSGPEVNERILATCPVGDGASAGCLE